MRDSSFSIFIFSGQRLIDVNYPGHLFSLESNTNGERVWMYQHIHILCSTRHSYPDCLYSDRGSYQVTGYGV